MEITYDKEADAMYIRLKKGKFFRNRVIDDNTILDLDKEGDILGIELLWVSERFNFKSVSDTHIKDVTIPLSKAKKTI